MGSNPTLSASSPSLAHVGTGTKMSNAESQESGSRLAVATTEYFSQLPYDAVTEEDVLANCLALASAAIDFEGEL